MAFLDFKLVEWTLGPTHGSYWVVELGSEGAFRNWLRRLCWRATTWRCFGLSPTQRSTLF